MNLKTTIVSFAAMLLVGAFATGCGADCESLCEDAKECEGATDAQKNADCAKSCADTEKAVEAAGCEDQYDDLLSCASDDVCATDACGTEAAAYIECLGPTQ